MKEDIFYSPALIGKSFVNNRGNVVKVRGFSVKDKNIDKLKKIWEKDIKELGEQDNNFYNPYKEGMYRYQVHVLYKMGINEWHNLIDYVKKLKEYVSSLKCLDEDFNNKWDKFENRDNVSEFGGKDFVGKIKDNFMLLQRLGGFNPYGYKLHQVGAAIDCKVKDRIGFNNGEYFYRLSIYENQEEALPIRDFSEYSKKPTNNKRFVGKIII